MKNPHLPELQKRIAQAPTGPGVYRWLDSKGDILYVGKAKNLRNRLKSYVQKPDKSLGPWKLSLIDHVADFDVTVVSNELEALLLETNLIKEHKPKYNVMMKDDKNYVYVRISLQEPYPSISIVRRMEEDHAKYFGPYLSNYDTRRILDALHMVYEYREEEKALERLNRAAEKGEVTKGVNPSLAYQIGDSCGVSIGKISREEYLERINAIVRFFKGHMRDAREKTNVLMQQAAQEKKFERAAKLRDALQLIDDIEEKQRVSDTSGENTDVVGMVMLNGKTQVVILREREGKVIDEQSYMLKGQADTMEEALDQFLPQYYAGIPELPDTVLINSTYDGVGVLAAWLTERKGKKVNVLIPERGKKAQLMQLAEKNAAEKLKAQEAKWEAAAKNIVLALQELKDALQLPAEPKRIEAYDISHLGGTETVGSMVVAINGKPNNKHYRSFTIQTLKEGDIDDYKALAEVLRRRLRYLAVDLKTEAAQWKEKGITFEKAKKNDQKTIEEILNNNADVLSNESVHSKDFIVARFEKNIIGFARLVMNEGNIREIKSVWVHDTHRGQKLGHIIIRKILSKEKNEKTYVIVEPTPKLEEYYTSIGFRHVHTPPAVLLQKTQNFCKDHPGAKEGMIMVYIPTDHKKDESLGTKPDLILIDGGKGQLSTVVQVLQAMSMQIPVIGLAKREEEVFVPDSSAPIEFPNDSQGKYLLMRLRNEAHRFANRHREKRLGKRIIGSALDTIPGIGPKTRQELLEQFGTVDGIKAVTDEQLLHILSQSQLDALRKGL